MPTLPPRSFKGPQLKTARRAADVKQIELAKGLGLTSHAPVARWENERSFPPAEKLVAIAGLLDVDVDVLFPRDGPCDLTDLRCDAGYTQSAAAERIEGLSRFTLGAAEGGERRLGHGWIAPLAALFGVSPDDLIAAQDRAFGDLAPPAEHTRPTTAERLRGLVEAAFPDTSPSPEAIAAAVNAKAGAGIVGPAQVAALLDGTPASAVFEGGAQAVAVAAMANFFGVSELALYEDATTRHRVLTDLQYLAAHHNITLAARGGEGGVSAAMLAVLNDLIAEHAPSDPGSP
ncbi:helix-turn-helix domain-containing protein [Streptomyces sp. NBC_01259]|uniref:helix-turn-helix domain-containing protein n=1 Tax=Streptomyces sp. NBC_01259 TaxID=2903800 RepID=UPI00324516DC